MGLEEPPLYFPPLPAPEAPLGLLAFVREFPKNPLRTVPRAAYEQDIVVLREFPGVAHAWITGPALIEEVLVKRAGEVRKSEMEARVFSRNAGRGVLTSDGPDWRWQRRTLAPLFRHQDILAAVPLMAGAADAEIAIWRKAGPRRRRIDLDMSRATYDVIVATLLGGRANRDTEIVRAASNASLDGTTWESTWTMLQLPRWLPHPGTWSLVRHGARMRAAVARIIAERRAQASGDTGTDLLGRLLSARHPETGEPMSETMLIDNLATLLLAGHETTAKALTWTLYVLARAPQWQDAVRQEVREIAGTNPVAPEHIDRLHLTTRVLKESMRLFPPVPAIVRVSTEPMTIGGEDLPAGSNLVPVIWCTHRHQKYWDDPHRFDPDRFLPEREALIKRTQFMPFGAGPRICLGQSFAMIEAITLLASFVRCARFTAEPGLAPEPVSRVTLHPRGGMPLGVEPL